ncbi:MAG TPA: adenosylmethionine--8-amino-7-oxononanoate transaminase [Planctomycetaceae bacterium]|nr:adenosylmethionine--8-amino-7-oxononanoate transaminase [Planctomycetaceae bacterium]
MSGPRPTNDQLREWDRQFVWHPFTQMAEYEPMIIERASGCTLIDIDGREYLDGVSSLWCNVHGHRHPRLDAALRAQLDKVAHVTSLGQSNPTTIELARRLVEIAPDGLEHVFFSDDGATAVEVALKMAFQYWRQRAEPRPEKTTYVALGDAYHGDTIGSVSVGGVERFHSMFRPLLFDVLRLPAPNPYRPPTGLASEEVLGHCLSELERLLAAEHWRIAAMVIEPLVQGAAGMIMHPRGYLRGVRELTRKYDVLLIADEVAVGMGRTGRMFASDHEQVAPDLLCLAKGLTGGYMPLAVTLATDEIYGAFLGDYTEGKTFFHGHTYGGNPLGAAVALATLDVFEEERTLEHLGPKIARLGEHLARIAELPQVGDARQCGMIGAIELVCDKATKEPFPWEQKRGVRVCQHALGHGVWIRPLGNVLVVMPPLAVSIDELDRLCAAVEEGIRVTASDGRQG